MPAAGTELQAYFADRSIGNSSRAVTNSGSTAVVLHVSSDIAWEKLKHDDRLPPVFVAVPSRSKSLDVVLFVVFFSSIQWDVRSFLYCNSSDG